jgi:hypothetical protein
VERQLELPAARQDETTAPADRSLEQLRHRAPTSRDHQLNLEIVLLLEELCQSALNDDAQGVAACSEILSETIRRPSASRSPKRPN